MNRIATVLVVPLFVAAAILLIGAAASSIGASGTPAAAAGYRDAWLMFWCSATCAVSATAVAAWLETR